MMAEQTKTTHEGQLQAFVANLQKRRFNAEQQEAILAGIDKPLLCLAPAGSGKTTLLVERIIKLCLIDKIHPSKIVAVTFTKKAANEMKDRLVKRHPNLDMVNTGTFHRIALDIMKMLRREIPNCPFTTDGHSIIDADGQKSVVRALVKANPPTTDLFKDSKKVVPTIIGYINNRKEEMTRSVDCIINPNNPIAVYCQSIYAQYERECILKRQLDFTEIILRLYEGLRDHQDIRAYVLDKIDYILVDEFQDTNPLQSAFLEVLLKASRPLSVVGDDDQSIYAWRGASNDFILKFPERNPGCKVVTLTENYRSTAPILDAANQLIDLNKTRHPKTLKSNKVGDRQIFTEQFYSAWDEARYVADDIKAKLDAGESISEMAILYRRNSLSYALETSLTERNIPYVMSNGVGFFNREEIKAALAYLTITHNPSDSAAFEYLCKYPKRGIGEKKIAQLNYKVASEGLSFIEALEEDKAKGCKDLHSVLTQVSKYQFAGMRDLINSVLHDTGLYDFFASMKDTTKSETKTDNLDVLEQLADQQTDVELEDFLENVSLTSEGNKTGEDGQSVTLSTIHSAKGLEFKHTYVVGFNEHIFPHTTSMEDPEQLEEERRLAYVAITRAKSHLSITSFKTEPRSTSDFIPSRFFKESGLSVNGQQNHSYMPDDFDELEW